MTTREERWQERLALPVLVAALASIPAMFLSVADGALGVTGRALDVASGAVLLGEAAVLFVVAENKRAWVRGHRGLIALSLAVVVAVVFAIGPVQMLRLVRTVGALRILRAGRIVKAAGVLRARAGFTGRLSHVFAAVAGLLVAVFVALVLSDPTSVSHSWLAWLLGEVDAAVVVSSSVAAGLALGAATFLLARDRGSGPDALDDDGADGGRVT
jgi:hypothetical protein